MEEQLTSCNCGVLRQRRPITIAKRQPPELPETHILDTCSVPAPGMWLSSDVAASIVDFLTGTCSVNTPFAGLSLCVPHRE